MSATRVGLVGSPLGHSLSPQLHAELYRRAGIAAAYELWELPADRWPADFTQQVQRDWRGLNITTPHKGRAFAACDAFAESAQLTQAVNHILVRPDGALLGTNFDVDGAYFTLQGIQAAIGPFKEAHLIGYGPAGRAVELALKRHWRAQKIEGRLKILKREPLPAMRGLVINATTSADLELPEGKYGLFDLHYPNPPTVLQHRGRGGYAVDGLPMLVWQGFFSAARWFPEQLDASRDVALAGEVLKYLRGLAL